MATTTLRYTNKDLESFPDDGQRYEVIDGELFVSTAPHADHQFAVDEITAAFRAWDPTRRYGLSYSGVGVIFAVDTGVIPDLVWVSTGRLTAVFHNADGVRDGKLHAAPELVVEVLSPGVQQEQRDRGTKRALYAKQKVAEYWIVDRERRRLDVYRRDATGALDLVAALTDTDSLTSPRLPGFALAVASIFQLPAPFDV